MPSRIGPFLLGADPFNSLMAARERRWVLFSNTSRIGGGDNHG
jgi:hypothetical protein